MTRQGQRDAQDNANHYARRANTIAAVSVVIALLSLAAALYGWLNPRDPNPQSTVPAYRDEIGQYEAGEKFLKFLDDNAGRKVYIETSLYKFEVSEEDHEYSFDIWDASCPRVSEGTPLANDQCEHNVVLIEDGKSAANTHLIFTSGAYNILGYFAVQGVVSARMNTIHRVIVPIGYAEAVN
jgi:hypothetical protein